MSPVSAASNSSDEAAKAGELVRTTGERVETSFWQSLNELLLHIPNILAFIAAIAGAWLVGRLLGAWLARRFDRNGKTDLGRLLGTSLAALVVFVAGMCALTLLFPRIEPGNILSLLGVGSIAVGFAFRDIFQNLVAGVILLFREPYKKGDEIRVGEFEGVVEEVETRATHIRTIDRRLVVIPNVRIFTEAITVNTDCEFRMTNLTLSIAYGSDPRRAMEIVLRAVKSADGVREDPEPGIAIEALNDYSIDLFIVYAAPSPVLDQIKTKGAVLLAIHDACRANDIALPFPTQVNLVQTFEGDRNPVDKLDGLPT